MAPCLPALNACADAFADGSRAAGNSLVGQKKTTDYVVDTDSEIFGWDLAVIWIEASRRPEVDQFQTWVLLAARRDPINTTGLKVLGTVLCRNFVTSAAT